ncbi:MAG: acetyl-CoA C-acetyltransferase, partial [Alphaproteobacteria bacterium]|nr:acetyl-CoA C-acetyltransferase [Alphaproteobacteria bacterium]
MESIVIASATRTAIGAFMGGLSTVSAGDLASTCIKESLVRAKVPAADVCEVLLGQILTAAQGQGPARYAAVTAGIPFEKTAYAINQICGSGLR